MSDAPDPPRKFYGLKAREFEVVNPPVASGGLPPHVEAAPTDVRDMARLAMPSGKLLGGLSRPSAENDVHAILRENLAKADAAGLNDLAPKPRRRSRRKRDYFFLLIVGNLVGGGLFAWQQGNIVVLAGMGLFNISLTWTMWFVMDDY